jgi:hypothetical protein
MSCAFRPNWAPADRAASTSSRVIRSAEESTANPKEPARPGVGRAASIVNGLAPRGENRVGRVGSARPPDRPAQSALTSWTVGSGHGRSSWTGCHQRPRDHHESQWHKDGRTPRAVWRDLPRCPARGPVRFLAGELATPLCPLDAALLLHNTAVHRPVGLE